MSLPRLPNGRNSFQLFVGVPGTCLVWFLLVLPPSAHAVASMTSPKATDDSTSCHSREYVSLYSLIDEGRFRLFGFYSEINDHFISLTTIIGKSSAK